MANAVLTGQTVIIDDDPTINSKNAASSGDVYGLTVATNTIRTDLNTLNDYVLNDFFVSYNEHVHNFDNPHQVQAVMNNDSNQQSMVGGLRVGVTAPSALNAPAARNIYISANDPNSSEASGITFMNGDLWFKYDANS